MAVTGTQGKTTTTRLLEGGADAAGVRAAVIGTVGTRIAGRDVKTALTTPEAPDLHALFAVMVEQGVTACAMEVSSHALVMGRVAGVVFDVAAFLNLGRDHLDFHKDVEDYFARQGLAVHPRAHPPWADQRRRRVRPPAARRGDRADGDLLAVGAAGRLARRGRRPSSPAGSTFTVVTPARGADPARGCR